MPGLTPHPRYLVRLRNPDAAGTIRYRRPDWLRTEGIRLTRRILTNVGLQAAPLDPEQLLLLHLVRE